eukprot:m.213190 g.213190  ORF g.213190 m.213190 type:complete len:193 (-) comp54021_c0_seq10:37-615(-)
MLTFDSGASQSCSSASHFEPRVVLSCFPSRRPFRLCSWLLELMSHGLDGLHVWDFVESVAKTREATFNKIKSDRNADEGTSSHRFFSLDAIAKAVGDINTIHGDFNNTNKDIKFRSFVCSALNAKALDVWLDVIAKAASSSLSQSYHEGAFLRGGSWIQVKSELRLLSSLKFNLALETELKHPELAVIGTDG